jgi:CHAT domain-containing protein
LAIAAFSAVLKVYTRTAFPEQWANTQNNLGNAYSRRVLGEKEQNIELAIAAFSGALEVYTRTAFPQKNATTLFHLGILYQSRRQFKSAYKSFIDVIATIESLRGEIISSYESKRKQAEEWNKFYVFMVEVCLELSNITEAIEYVERSKTRNLVELILENDSKTIFPSEVVAQLEKLRDEIASGQYQLQNGKAENPTALAENLQQLRQQRQALQDNYLPVGSGFKFDQFQETVDDNTAVIEWYIAIEKIIVFVLKPNGQKLTVWQSQPEDFKTYCDWVDKYLQDYNNQKDQWQNNLEKELKKLSSFLHIDEILKQIPKSCDRLILIPHRELHLFPLHALPVTIKDSENSACLLDLFTRGVSYAPSCQILQQVQQRKRLDFQSLFAIQNPTEDLDYADLEVDNILNLFSSHQVLPYKQATKAALLQQMPQTKEANCLHFSCHGSFNFESPQDSCLKLAESVDENDELDLSKCLTLSNLFEREFQLDNCRLVILSACETGLIDSNNTSDEYIGLPSGFLYAGSTSVVSSLWTVDDVSTALLIIRFYQNIKNGLTVAVALNQAQIWLRDATTVELQSWASKLQLTPKQAENIEVSLDWFDSDEQPFQNPYWWSGFCAIGN